MSRSCWTGRGQTAQGTPADPQPGIEHTWRSTASSLKTSSMSGGACRRSIYTGDRSASPCGDWTRRCSGLAGSNLHAFSHQHEEYAHKQQALFQEFDGAIKDKDETVHTLQCELASHKEHTLTMLEKARMDAEHVASMSRPVFADGLSTQPYATPIEKWQCTQWPLWLMQFQFHLTLQDVPWCFCR